MSKLELKFLNECCNMITSRFNFPRLNKNYVAYNGTKWRAPSGDKKKSG